MPEDDELPPASTHGLPRSRPDGPFRRAIAALSWWTTVWILVGLVLNATSTWAAARGPERTTAGPTTWGPNGEYIWKINDATGSAGLNPGWDLLEVAGTLSITATVEEPFVIGVRSLTGTTPGLAAHFDASGVFVWKIATASDGVAGFDAAKFRIDPTGFNNWISGGTFVLRLRKSEIQLVFVGAGHELLQPGHFSATGYTPGQPAPKGRYVDHAGATEATPAPPGTYVDIEGAVAPTRARPGYFAVGPGAIEELPAPPGKYVPESGAWKAIDARPGHYAPGPAAIAEIPAPLGHYVDLAGFWAPKPARKGHYVDHTAATQDTPAPPGTYVDVEGAQAPTPARPGHYAPGPGATEDIPAPPGYYVPESRAAWAIPAPVGTYVPQSAATVPYANPAGTWTHLASPYPRSADAGVPRGGTGVHRIVGPEFGSDHATGEAILVPAGPATRKITLRNLSADLGRADSLTDLTILSVSFDGSGAGRFSVPDFPASGVVLHELGSYELSWVVAATAAGASQTARMIMHTDQGAPPGGTGKAFAFDLVAPENPPLETPAVFALALGDTVSPGRINALPFAGAGTIEVAGNIDEYSFTGEAGRKVYLELPAPPDGLLAWSVFEPDGTLWRHGWMIADIGASELPVTGVYRIQVFAPDSRTPTYRFRLREQRPPVAGDDVAATVEDKMVSLPVDRLLANDKDPDRDRLTLSLPQGVTRQGGTVAVVDGNVRYTPNPGFKGSDAFTYLVEDGFGGTSVATVTVTVRATTGPGSNVVRAHRRSDGVVELDMAGLPGRSYRIEATSDFAHWASLGQFTAGSNGLIRQVDASAAGVPSRFYRLAEVP